MEYKGSRGVYKLEAQPMKAGGEGSIYALQSQANMVAKIYHPEKLSSELEEKLTYMTNNPPESSILDQIAWPLDILRDFSGRFVGFVMPKLSISTDLKAIYAYPPTPKIPITYEQKVIVAINICVVIAAIHKAGYTFGDFNPLNIGINLQNGHVAFLDTDSYHIKDTTSGKVYRCEVCLDGYVAPELIQHCKGTDYAHATLPTFTQETDRFALAIHVFKLLMNGYTPFNGIKEAESASQASPGIGNDAILRDSYCFKPGNKPQSVATPDMSSLTPDIQYLFKKTFIGGANDPSQRATAEEWLHALCEYKDNLTQCSKDPAHYYYISNNSCPYCDADKRYQQSMSRATSSARKGTAQQMNFGNPVNVPPATGLNAWQQQTQTQVKRRILLWIFLFPVMLCIKIGKSNKLSPFWKVALIYWCLQTTIALIIYPIGFLTDALFSDDPGGHVADYNPGGSSNTTQTPTGPLAAEAPIIVEGKYQVIRNDVGYTIRVKEGGASALTGEIALPSEFRNRPITAIAEDGFANCSNVTSFIIPESVTSIGEGAFKGCSQLQSITLPFIGKQIDAEKHEAVLGYIFGYTSTTSNVQYSFKEDYFLNEKPSDIAGQVWQYTWRDFNQKTDYYYFIPESLKYVTITKQTNIPDAAFNGCSNLLSVQYLSGDQTKIKVGEAAFQNCSNLIFEGGELIIPNNIIEIGSSAYAGCVNITDIVVPDTVSKIGCAAFRECNNIQSLTLPFVGETETATGYKAVFGYIFGYEAISTDAHHAGSYDCFLNQEPVEIIGQTWQYTWQEFSQKTDYYYYMPETLNTVTITKQASVPDAAFNGCSNLTTIEYLSENRGKAKIGAAAFQNCSNLNFENGHLVVPEGIIEIGASAYAGCSNIEEVTVPKTVRSIGLAAFAECENIRSMTLPFVGESEAATGYKSVFGYIFGYETITTDGMHPGKYNCFANQKPVEIIGQTWQYSWQEFSKRTDYYFFIPEGVTSLTITKQTKFSDVAWNGCKNIAEITLPEGSVYGEFALQDCNADIKYISNK